MDWNQAQERGQRVWVHVRERTAFSQPQQNIPWHAKLLRFLMTALVIGLLAILLILGLTVGLVVLAIIAVVVLIRRAFRALAGGFVSGGAADQGRRNVRVVNRQ